MFDITLIHPKLVHFPIAFLLGALALDVWGAIRKNEFYHRVAWVQLVLALVFAVLAVVSGLLAANNVPHNDLSHETMETHETLGYIIAAVLLVLFVWRWRLQGNFPQKGAALYWLVLVIGSGLMVYSSDLGGKMVYEYGVAVKAVPQHDAGDHSHGEEGGHSHGEATSDAHSHDGENAGGPHKETAAPATDTTQNKKTVHTHDDGTVHEH